MKKILISLTLIMATLCLSAKNLVVATYNVRNDNNNDARQNNGWQQRFPVIAELVRFHDFDILGTQEAFHHQLGDLKSLMPEYEYIGIGRDDGKDAGEHSAIFYKREMFNLLDKGDFWMSENTTEPNRGWDAALPRICSWGKFEIIETGHILYFFNLHMDHVGVKARRESAKLVIEKIKEIAKDNPVILTGDFNVDQYSDSYAEINNSGLVKDSYETAPVKYATNGTFNDFDVDSKTDSRIDHIFLTTHFKAQRYGVLTDTYRMQTPESPMARRRSSNFPKEVQLRPFLSRLPSDHFPVVAKIELPDELAPKKDKAAGPSLSIQ